jgi:hypothetical protein
MNGTPSNIYNKILPFGIPFFYPIPPINLLFRYHGHLKRYSEVKDEEVTREMLFAFSLSDLLINFWKYGPNEWSGNYMLKKENENWPLLFSYNKREPNQAIFIDNLIEFKRSQNDTRSIEGKINEEKLVSLFGGQFFLRCSILAIFLKPFSNDLRILICQS